MDRERALDMLTRLVEVPTQNPPGEGCEECAGLLADWLRSAGLRVREVRVPNSDPPRVIVVGEAGSGRPLYLHGHYDVVPGSPEQFVARVEGDLVFGRGSSDMKGGIVSEILAAEEALRRGVDLPLRVVLVPDEETGGAMGTAYALREGLIGPGLGMLMAEPTSGRVWHACRGALTLRLVFRGRRTHIGTAHLGENAFEKMARAACRLADLAASLAPGETSLPISEPFSRRSSVVLGGVCGSGDSSNTVPGEAFFTLDARLNPELDPSDVERAVREAVPEAEVEVLVSEVGHVSPEDSELALALSRAVEEVRGSPPRFELCPGLLEIRFYGRAGVPAYCYGPGLLEVSHGPGEYVRLSDVLECAEVYLRTMEILAGSVTSSA